MVELHCKWFGLDHVSGVKWQKWIGEGALELLLWVLSHYGVEKRNEIP